MCFHDQVYEKMKNDVRDSVVALISRDRENEHIDRSLLKKVLGFLDEMSIEFLNEYEKDFEPAILNDAAIFYGSHAALWAMESSAAEFEVMVKESLESERGRVSHYLCKSSEDVLELVERISRAMWYDYPSLESELFRSRSTSPPDDKIRNTRESSTPSRNSNSRVMPMDFEAGWTFVQKGITKLKNLLEGIQEQRFTSGECMELYTIVFEICVQAPGKDSLQQLYDRYQETFKEYMYATVVPALQRVQDDFLLEELVKRWENHKLMVRWLLRFFEYVDRHRPVWLPSLQKVASECFLDQVYAEMKENIEMAVKNLIRRVREHEQEDQALLKNVRGVLEELGIGGMFAFESDIEFVRSIDFALRNAQYQFNGGV